MDNLHLNRTGVTQKELLDGVNQIARKMAGYESAHSIDTLSMAMISCLPEVAGRVDDGTFHLLMSISAALYSHHSVVPPPPVPDSVAVIGDAVSEEVLHHIDVMYPAMWTAVPKLARTSVQNTIRAQVGRIVCLAMDQDARSDTGELLLTEKRVFSDDGSPKTACGKE